MSEILLHDKHIEYFLACLKFDNNLERISSLFIILSGLETLNAVAQITFENRRHIIDWLYSQQAESGFRCSSISENISNLDCGFISMNYCAIVCLCILDDNLSRLNKKLIISELKSLQTPEGNFKPSSLGGEQDVRIVYCAVSTSYILDDWSGIDIDRCSRYLMNCLTYEGAFGQCPNAEAHGGLTYCAIASLKLMSTYDKFITKKIESQLVRWCVDKFSVGFAGRPNKEPDTCYSFWIGATLVMLGNFDLIDHSTLVDFVLSTQDENGGIAKVLGNYSDPLHTFLGLAGISFVNSDTKKLYNLEDLSLIDPKLNLSFRVKKNFEHLKQGA